MWENFKFACIVLGVALGYFGFCSLIGALLAWLDGEPVRTPPPDECCTSCGWGLVVGRKELRDGTCAKCVLEQEAQTW